MLMTAPKDKEINKNNMPKENLQDKAKRKRELLQKFAQRNQGKDNPVKKTQTKKVNVSVNKVEKLNQQLAKYKQKNDLQQLETCKLRKALKDIKQENYHLKKENKEARLRNQRAKQANELLNQKLQERIDLLNRQVKHKNDFDNWLMQNGVVSRDSFKKYADSLVQQTELTSLLFQIQAQNNKKLFASSMDFRKDNKKLQKELDQSSDKIQALKNERAVLKEKNASQQREIEMLKGYIERQNFVQKAAPDKLIELLIQKCSTDNFSYYDNVDGLINKYQHVLNLLIHQTQGRLYRYGYIKFEGDGYKLHDINADTDIPVKVCQETLNNPYFVDGVTARCQKDGKGWKVGKIYYLSERLAEIHTTKRISKQNKMHVHKQNDRKIVLTNSDELDWAKKQKVLVVGNKFSSGFLDELKKYCNVQVDDGYEDNMHQISGDMQKADYVFLLIGSVPHIVTEHTKNNAELNESSTKIQIFDTPAKYDGVIRLHYLFANKN